MMNDQSSMVRGGPVTNESQSGVPETKDINQEALASNTVAVAAKSLKILTKAIYESNRTPEILVLLKEEYNLKCLIQHTLKNDPTQSKNQQMKLLKLLTIAFGKDVFVQSVFHLLNEFTDSRNEFDAFVQTTVSPLFHCGQLTLGIEVYQCVPNILLLPGKKPRFWHNVSYLLEMEPYCSKVDFDLEALTDYFSEIMLESHGIQHYSQVLHILKLICWALEKNVQEAKPSPRHKLSSSLAVNYFSLIESLHENFKSESFDLSEEAATLIMQSLILAQKCMNLLAKWLPVNQDFLCRSLLELAVESSALFSNILSRPLIVDSSDSKLHVNLLEENRRLEGSHSMRFRKTALVPKSDLPCDMQKKMNENNVMNREAAMDAFRAASLDSLAFANLFIDIVAPDVLYNDQLWPEEEYLKVTIERDLTIYRRFECNPLLWDLLEHITKTGCLAHCSPIIRSLLAIQLTQWGAATPQLDGKLESTQRLISLIAEGELVPNEPGRHLAEVINILHPWETHCLLTDLYRFLKESLNSSEPIPFMPYLERLRVIMSLHYPGPEFVRIFQSIED